MLKWQTQFNTCCWPTIVFENHDNPRFLSRITKNEAHRNYAAKLIIMLMLTLKGTPYFYQGQEIGMIDSVFSKPSDLRDVEAINMYNMYLEKGMSQQEAMDKVSFGTRDHARIPMQWEDSAYGGFSKKQPWIDCSRDYMKYNVKSQLTDCNSILNFMKNLIALRKENEALVYGSFINAANDDDTFCYYRKIENQLFYIELNLIDTNKKRRIDVNNKKYNKILSNYTDNDELLRPFEANIYMIGDNK